MELLTVDQDKNSSNLLWPFQLIFFNILVLSILFTSIPRALAQTANGEHV